MAQFRTTADLLDLALQDAGEVTNGNSPYETQALNYLNKVHMAIVAGGTIPIGKDQTVEIDEVWLWSRARSPLILELQPKYSTGSITLTLGSESGVFSVAPSFSVEGWFLKIDARNEWLRFASHTAGATAFELDGAYPDASGGFTFEAMKIDYDLVPTYVVISSSNNKLQFQEAAGVTLTATLTSGSYTPAALTTEVQTQLNATGGTPVYTVTYSAVTRKFTIASDRGGGAVFVLVGTGSQSEFGAHKTLGFDDENTTNAASVVSTYVLGGIARLIEPMKIHRSNGGNIYGIDPESFERDFPIHTVEEGFPDRLCVVRESADGTLTVRFNRFPKEKTRVEVEHVAVPRDLKDSAASVPLIPRKHVDVLQDAATFYIMLNKSDDRAMTYANLMQGKLKAMIAQNRGSLVRSGKGFGQIVPRIELTQIHQRRRRLFPQEPY